MLEQSENKKNWLIAVDKLNECGRLLDQYEAGKMTLANGENVDIPPEKITSLVQAFVAARNECKAALDAITG